MDRVNEELSSRSAAVRATISPSLSKRASNWSRGSGSKATPIFGATVQHLVRVAEDPTKPNVRQVHLMHSELFEELRCGRLFVGAGQVGENITTRGIDLLGLPDGTRLHIGKYAVVLVTGLRNPCKQLDNFQPG
jgi:hypothetical protein